MAVNEPPLPDAAAIRRGRDRVRAHGATSVARQWTGFLLAPVTFFAHLQVAYVLVPWSCMRDDRLWLHVAGALSVLLALTGAAVAWSVWSRESDDGLEPPGEHGGPRPRARLLGVTGFVMGLMVTLLLAVQWAATLFLSPCA